MGLRIEQHAVTPDRDVCVWYKDDKRVAVLYIDDTNGCTLVHEEGIQVKVFKRRGANFDEEKRP
jgi:hypothetical protein